MIQIYSLARLPALTTNQDLTYGRAASSLFCVWEDGLCQLGMALLPGIGWGPDSHQEGHLDG